MGALAKHSNSLCFSDTFCLYAPLSPSAGMSLSCLKCMNRHVVVCCEWVGALLNVQSLCPNMHVVFPTPNQPSLLFYAILRFYHYMQCIYFPKNCFRWVRLQQSITVLRLCQSRAITVCWSNVNVTCINNQVHWWIPVVMLELILTANNICDYRCTCMARIIWIQMEFAIW